MLQSIERASGMKKRDTVEVEQITSTPDEFSRHLSKASEIVDSWPDWKRSTRATSFPRPSLDAMRDEPGQMTTPR